MKVQVERCWNGRDMSWRVSWTDPVTRRSHRESVPSEEWNRTASSRALDLLEVHGVKRKNVRFDVR